MNISVSKSHPWYFDSGCSRHMTTNKYFFTTFTNFDGGNVTFGDGNMGRVKDEGSICALGIPNLEEVLCVEGIKANLINISQLCENKLNVQFSQNVYKMFNLNGDCVMIGLKACGNCYVFSQKAALFSSLVFESFKTDLVDHLWHHRLV